MQHGNKIKVVTLCSGYDSQCLALDELKQLHPDFDYELVGWSEIDKFAIQSHNNLYPQWADRNLGDMTKIDWQQIKDKVGDIDLLTYSTPCTDVSQAGLQKGIKKGSDTRSSILWFTEEAIRILRPKYLLQENVKALVSKKFLPDFLEWCRLVEGYGYKNFYTVLNAKDYGVPQNRERVFMVSCLFDEHYRFPSPFSLQTKLADLLEDEVDESYYLSDDSVRKFLMLQPEEIVDLDEK